MKILVNNWERLACGLLLLLTVSGDGAEPATSVPPTGDALRLLVEKSLHIQAVRDSRDKTLVEVMIQVDHPPVAMGFDVSIRAGDKTIPVGPMTWGKKIRWWAYDVDVPVDVTMADFIFTSNPRAVVRSRWFDTFPEGGIDTIWDGRIEIKGVKLSEQRLSGMIAKSPPSPELLRLIFSEEMEGNDEIVTRFRRDGELAAARTGLEPLLQANPGNATIQLNLGCLAATAGDWQRAVEILGRLRDSQPNSALAEKARRQLRRIGGYLIYAADREAVPAMFTLGLMFDRAWGPARDRQTAKRWFRNAANAGSAAAMTRLGILYAEDLLDQKDPKIRAWYQKEMLAMFRQAAELGDEEAKSWQTKHDPH